MIFRYNRSSTALALLLGAGLVMTVGSAEPFDHGAFVPSANAQPLRKLIARLRGQTLPDGITKAEGRAEATQVDVSSKYPGRLAEISVDEGTKVTAGQVIARVSSPEFEAQLRAAQSDLQSAKDAVIAAEADIASRTAALEFAKSDFERGQELMKTGFITKQVFDERRRNYDGAQAAVQTKIAQRDEGRKAIEIAKARLQQIQAMIDDLTLVSPRNGAVQYKLKRVGETVAAGEPIVTVLDLTDIYMIVFLHAADAGRVTMDDEARVVLDAVAEYVIPAHVSFIASDSQFTPKTVETEDERKKLMFRVNLRIDPEELKKYYGRVEGGLRGAGFVLTSRDAKWPAELQVRLPPSPAVPPVAEASPPAAAASATEAPTAVAPEPVTQTPVASPPSATPPPATPQPIAEASSAPPPAQAVEARAPEMDAPPAQQPAAPPVANPPAVAEPATPTTPVRKQPAVRVAQEPVPEFAPESLAQLTGAWAYSQTDCDKTFLRRGKALAYRQPVDKFAQAAIVEPQRIRLPSATCQIERASNEDGAFKVSGDCQDSISYTSRTVYIKLKSDNAVTYSATGDPVLATTLMRCAL
jgi:HlyD family secretion protein